jgi:hypothetical protein
MSIPISHTRLLVNASSKKLPHNFLDRREPNGLRLIERRSRPARPTRALSDEEIKANIVSFARP